MYIYIYMNMIYSYIRFRTMVSQGMCIRFRAWDQRNGSWQSEVGWDCLQGEDLESQPQGEPRNNWPWGFSGCCQSSWFNHSFLWMFSSIQWWFNQQTMEMFHNQVMAWPSLAHGLASLAGHGLSGMVGRTHVGQVLSNVPSGNLT